MSKLYKDKKDKKTFLKKLYAKIYLIILAILAIGLFVFLILNIFILIGPEKDTSSDFKEVEKKLGHEEILDETESEMLDEINNSEPSNNAVTNSIAFINSFGDNFSSGAHLNMGLTNMYLDDLVTGLTFTPLYNFTKIKDCAEENCGLENKLEIDGDNIKACLGDKCLEVKGSSLIYDNNTVDLPEAIKDKNILSLTISGLSSKWLVGIVTGSDYNEAGFVYYFDGKNFTPLITDTTPHRIEPKYNKQRGKIGFGGDDDNFLIVYSGYAGIAFHVYNDEIVDVSNFFGLGVTNRGFWPQIIKINDHENTTWYVCSLSDDNPKFVKLWQNNTSRIQGVIDFTYKVFNNGLSGDNTRCYPSSDGSNEIYFVVDLANNLHDLSDRDEETLSANQQLWKFEDNGFDNSHNYTAISKNLMNKDGFEVVNAVVQEMGLFIESDGSPKNYMTDFSGKATMSLSNDNKIWQEVSIGRRLTFPSPNNEIYWHLELEKGENNNYSPWLDHINKLNYGLRERK